MYTSHNVLKISFFTVLALLLSFNTAFAGWDEGVAAFKAGNFKVAAKEFQTASVQNPDTWGNHYMLGLSMYKLGKTEAAVNHLRKAYDLNPNKKGITLDNGLKITLDNGLKKGLSLKGNKQKATLSYLYGTTALKMGMKKDGERAIKVARELDPANKAFWR